MSDPLIDDVKKLDPDEGAETDCTASRGLSIIASEKDLASAGSEEPNALREPIYHLQPIAASIDAAVLNGLKQAVVPAEAGCVAQHETAVRMMREQEAALRSQISKYVEMIPFQPIRARLPDVVLTPEGREDFTYILGRLVTSGACSLSEVGDVPFPKVIRLFEYWKTHPPAHETLIRINDQLSAILSEGDQGLGQVRPSPDGPKTEARVATHAEAAARRQRVVMPILEKNRWKRGRWASKAGVGKNCVYEYLDGKRDPNEENRRAMADALGLKPEELPE